MGDRGKVDPSSLFQTGATLLRSAKIITGNSLFTWRPSHREYICLLNIIFYCLSSFFPLQFPIRISFRLHDADLGYVLIVDRRGDRWNAVKTTLLRLSVRITQVSFVICVCPWTLNRLLSNNFQYLFLIIRTFSRVSLLLSTFSDRRVSYKRQFQKCLTNSFETISNSR